MAALTTAPAAAAWYLWGMDPMAETLGRELEAYEKMREELLAHHKGKFALVKNGTLQGTFTTEAEAYEDGVARFGANVFLVRLVLDDQPAVTMPALFAGLVHATP